MSMVMKMNKEVVATMEAAANSEHDGGSEHLEYPHTTAKLAAEGKLREELVSIIKESKGKFRDDLMRMLTEGKKTA